MKANRLLLFFLPLCAALAQAFDPALFRNPPVDFYPSAFWLWNDRMTTQRIREQLADMHQHKLLALCIMPMPRDFRPDSTGNRLDVEYLSDEYFARYRFATEEARKLGMKGWLYDEGGWPSGSATGRVVRSDPSLGAQTLVTERRPLAPGEKIATPTGAVSAFAENGNTLVVCRAQRSNFHPDRLNPAATKRFIELTHEGYRRTMPEYLGSWLPWAFTDEPAVPSVVPGKQIPWTDALPQVFRESKGYDLIAKLPLLLSNPPPLTPDALRVRIDFYDVWSRLFQEAYLLPIRDWCRQHGILSGGHFGGDDETTGSARYGYGHILRAQRGLDLPGVDAIWRQIFPGQRNHHFPRYASSVARQDGRRLVMTESYAVYGNGLTLAEMKWILDYQYVRGCNMLVMGCYPGGTSGNLMPGERPHFGPMSPLWRYQPLFQDYAARLGYILSLGQAATDVALYYPVRDFWAAGQVKVTPESQANDDVALELERRQVDFDLVDDDLLQPEFVRNGALRAGKMSYRTLVISRCRMMPDRTAEAIARFVRGGGTLVAVDALPETGPLARKSLLAHLEIEPLRMGERRAAGKGSVILETTDQFYRRVPPALVLEPFDDSMRVTARRLSTGTIFLITNEADRWASVTPRLRSQSSTICDPETGDILKAPRTLRIAPWGSLCLLLDVPTDAREGLAEPDESRAFPIDGEWQIRRLSHVEIEGDDFAQVNDSSAPWQKAMLGDWKGFVGGDFSGTGEYRVIFDNQGPPGQEKLLDLGKVAAAAELWLNGQRLGARAWPPYRFRTGNTLRSGRNELRIQVTNTLANYLVSPEVRKAWASRKGPGWPGPYDGRAHEFEKQSTASGLVGPVRLLGISGGRK